MLTWYIISVHPSSVTHWNTVNIARPMLSKLVMPSFGPSQPSRHSRLTEPPSLPINTLSSSMSHMTPFFEHGWTGSTISPGTNNCTHRTVNSLCSIEYLTVQMTNCQSWYHDYHIPYIGLRGICSINMTFQDHEMLSDITWIDISHTSTNWHFTVTVTLSCTIS